MSESQVPGRGEPARRSPAELLLDAIDGLPLADRRRVLLWLLESGPRANPAGPAGPAGWAATAAYRRGAVARLSELPAAEYEGLVSRFTALRGEHQVVPVRLETDRYERLRDWCGQHGFSMATVIRGLLARFLDEQQPAAASGAADAAEPAGSARTAGPPQPAGSAASAEAAGSTEAATDAALDAAAREAAAKAAEEGGSV